MTSKEWRELIHETDTAGEFVFDLHCPACINGTHSKSVQSYTFNQLTIEIK